jgi:beta-lactamase superfamily II metal-dependent hydrolase
VGTKVTSTLTNLKSSHTKFLATGAVEAPRIGFLSVKREVNLGAEMFKVFHHGSNMVRALHQHLPVIYI